MNAAVVHSFDTLPQYESFPDPVPQEGEVLIRVAAAGLHPIVKALAAGSHYGAVADFPFIAGIDGTGRLPDGSRVLFGGSRKPYAPMAELAIAPASICLPLPDTLEDTTAAALANPGMSSWAALKFRAQFKPGESLLILGATGVAGRLAIQIAHRLGARRIVACGRNPQALQELSSLGADAVVSLDQSDEDLVKALRTQIAQGIDVVLDYLWGKPADCAIQAIGQKGLSHTAPRIRFVQIGESAGHIVPLAASSLRSSGLEILGSGFGAVALHQILAAVTEFLAEAARSQFRFDVEPVPLSNVTEAWSRKEQGTRIVFTP